MVKYAAYGVLYKNGKKMTKTPYRISVGKTAKEAKSKAVKYNRSWNKQPYNKKGKWVAKFVKVKKVQK